MQLALVVAVLAVALVFAWTNGFHDAANAIATSVSTRALTPRVALVMAAAMNFLGAFLSQDVARTVAEIIAAPSGSAGLVVVLAALVGAIVWNLVTWWYGLPSSSTHALVGGLVGAGLVSASTVRWDHVGSRVLVPMLVLPVLGFAVAAVAMVAILWGWRGSVPAEANRQFRMLQTFSASAMALGHGLQDAQKVIGVMALALATGGYAGTARDIPLWVVTLAAAAISLGTYAGGWRIMRTLGRRIIDLDPPSGFAAESTAAAMLYAAALVGAPVSTTYTITATITGAGAARRPTAVRWPLLGHIAVGWLLTLPAAGACAAAVCLLLRPLAT